MEIQLQDLIEQIKKDGVCEAEKSAEEILEKARADAEKIIADAKADAEEMRKSAKEENARLVRASEDAIRQAGRNLLISFRESVARELCAVAGASVSVAYSKDNACRIISNAIEAWSKNPDAESLTVLLSESDLKELEGALMAELSKKLVSGVTLKPSEGIDAGFRISQNSGEIYYDYSAEAVCEMLSAYLSPKVALLMKEAGRV